MLVNLYSPSFIPDFYNYAVMCFHIWKESLFRHRHLTEWGSFISDELDDQKVNPDVATLRYTQPCLRKSGNVNNINVGHKTRYRNIHVNCTKIVFTFFYLLKNSYPVSSWSTSILLIACLTTYTLTITCRSPCQAIRFLEDGSLGICD